MSIHKEVRQWVAANIVRWKNEQPSWFKIEMIPDDLLPPEVYEEEGGDNRRRASNFNNMLPEELLTIVSTKKNSRGTTSVYPEEE